jgi:hypothetical protein
MTAAVCDRLEGGQGLVCLRLPDVDLPTKEELRPTKAVRS